MDITPEKSETKDSVLAEAQAADSHESQVIRVHTKDRLDLVEELQTPPAISPPPDGGTVAWLTVLGGFVRLHTVNIIYADFREVSFCSLLLGMCELGLMALLTLSRLKVHQCIRNLSRCVYLKSTCLCH